MENGLLLNISLEVLMLTKRTFYGKRAFIVSSGGTPEAAGASSHSRLRLVPSGPCHTKPVSSLPGPGQWMAGRIRYDTY